MCFDDWKQRKNKRKKVVFMTKKFYSKKRFILKTFYLKNELNFLK